MNERKQIPGGLSLPQLMILGLVFILLTGLLVAVSAWVFAAGPTPSPAALQPTSTDAPVERQNPAASATLLATPTAQIPPNLIPLISADCARQGREALLASVVTVQEDGTIQAQVGGEILAVRLAGIQTTAGLPVGQRVQELISGHNLVLVRDPALSNSDSSLVRYVFAGGQFINYELARDGLAQVIEGGPDLACAAFLRDAQALARADRLGMWKPTPVATLTFVPLVTLGPGQYTCDCSRRYTCGDFTTHDAAQACFNACIDYNSMLDEDRDGIACENLP